MKNIKKFLLQFILFILPILLFALPLDYLISVNFKNAATTRKGAEMSVWNDIYASKINAEIAIYGSSRARQHINPQILEDVLGKTAYNFGMDGSMFRTQYLRHKEFLKHNPNPKIILYSVDIFTFEKTTNLFNSNQFLPYMIFNETIKQDLQIFSDVFSFYDYYLPLIRYAGRWDVILLPLQNLFFRNKSLAGIFGNPSHEIIRKKGFFAESRTWTNEFEEIKKNMKSYKVQVDEKMLDLFGDFILECKKNQIKIILFYAPEYIEGQKFTSNRKEILDLYRQIAEKYKIPFLDFSNDKICFEKKYFYNAEHLNAAGAEYFSKSLAGQLDSF